jgi:SAM-dependent methyltransferase
MLEEKNNYWHLLRCPKTRLPLKQIDPKNLVTDSIESNQQFRYRFIKTIPVLVDFDSSILDEKETFDTSAERLIDSPFRKGIPDILKKLVSPPEVTTANNVRELISLLKSQEEKPRVLFVGGGSIGQGMLPFYDDKDIKVLGFDIFFSPFIQFIADAHLIPLADESVDCVIVQAVLEHVLEPNKVVSEIYRVLKSNGLVYAETPFLQQVHEGAYDFTRFTESGHRYIFKHFELIKSGNTAGAGTQLLWTIDYFSRSLFRSKVVGKILKLIFFWVRYLDLIIPENYSIDTASGVFFMGKKSHKTITPQEIVKHYKGLQK